MTFGKSLRHTCINLYRYIIHMYLCINHALAIFAVPSFGDPHVISADRFTYTFNGLGEYLYADIANGETIIQARTLRAVDTNGSKLLINYIGG